MNRTARSSLVSLVSLRLFRSGRQCPVWLDSLAPPRPRLRPPTRIRRPARRRHPALGRRLRSRNPDQHPLRPGRPESHRSRQLRALPHPRRQQPQRHQRRLARPAHHPRRTLLPPPTPKSTTPPGKSRALPAGGHARIRQPDALISRPPSLSRAGWSAEPGRARCPVGAVGPLRVRRSPWRHLAPRLDRCGHRRRIPSAGQVIDGPDGRAGFPRQVAFTTADNGRAGCDSLSGPRNEPARSAADETF